jgi:acetaldehyde dehydrogenase/alcohol dehydrogenase
MGLDELAEVEAIMERARSAAAVFSQFDQEATDHVLKAAYEAGFAQRVRLAKMAHEETGIGNWRDKVLKNVFATQMVYQDIRREKTVGVLSEDEERGIVEIAQPLGPIFAFIPVTNPTSTTLFKILLALKTRNPIIIHPHSMAKGCSAEAARVCYEAALEADAPEFCVQTATGLSREGTQALMGHRDMALILATGGAAMVRAAYSSGTPAIGVGAGNVPVFVERSADLPFAAEQILMSKTFDNGTICSSEQAIVVEACSAEGLRREIQSRGGYFLRPGEISRLGPLVFDREKRVMRVDAVGKPVAELAGRAGIALPEGTRLLLAPLEVVDEEHVLASEILAPVLAWYEAKDFVHAVNLCLDLNFHGGIGHTVSIYSNDEAKIRNFAFAMNAGRILVNTPSSQGGIGYFFNALHPSLTLGCGTWGKNSTTDNVTAKHLINVNRIARRRVNERFGRFDKSLYYDESLSASQIESVYDKNV